MKPKSRLVARMIAERNRNQQLGINMEFHAAPPPAQSPGRGKGSKYDARIAELIQHPNEWARIDTVKNASVSGLIGRLKRMNPNVVCASRRIIGTNKTDVWASFQPPAAVKSIKKAG